MTALIVSELLAKKIIKRTVQNYIVEGITFSIMALDKEMKEMVADCETHEEMCFYAADNGIALYGERFVDMDGFKDDDLIDLWAEDLGHIESDPCVKQRVGEKVCEISGLSSVLNKKLEDERVFKLGDHDVPGSTTLDSLPDVTDENLTQESLDAEDTVIYANA